MTSFETEHTRSNAATSATARQLLATVELLQQQLSDADSARLDAENRTQTAASEIAQLENDLHQVLRHVAALDDHLQAAQLVLNARLHQKAEKFELLRKQQSLLEVLRKQAEELQQLRTQKDAIVADLKGRLVNQGVARASLAQLEMEAQQCSPAQSTSPQREGSTDMKRKLWFTGNKSRMFFGPKAADGKGGS